MFPRRDMSPRRSESVSWVLFELVLGSEAMRLSMRLPQQNPRDTTILKVTRYVFQCSAKPRKPPSATIAAEICNPSLFWLGWFCLHFSLFRGCCVVFYHFSVPRGELALLSLTTPAGLARIGLLDEQIGVAAAAARGLLWEQGRKAHGFRSLSGAAARLAPLDEASLAP